MAEKPSEDVQYCPSCGATQSLQSGFCSECGTALGGGAETAAGTPAQPRDSGHQHRPPQGGRAGGPGPQPPAQQDEGWSTAKIVVVALGVVFLAIPVTVVLAAVIAAFVLGLGDTTEIAPQPTIESTYHEENTTLQVEVASGDSFAADQVRVEGQGIEDPGAYWYQVDGDTEPGDVVSAGDSIALDTTGPDFRVELHWESEDGETTAVIYEKRGPAP